MPESIPVETAVSSEPVQAPPPEESTIKAEAPEKTGLQAETPQAVPPARRTAASAGTDQPAVASSTQQHQAPVEPTPRPRVEEQKPSVPPTDARPRTATSVEASPPPRPQQVAAPQGQAPGQIRPQVPARPMAPNQANIRPQPLRPPQVQGQNQGQARPPQAGQVPPRPPYSGGQGYPQGQRPPQPGGMQSGQPRPQGPRPGGSYQGQPAQGQPRPYQPRPPQAPGMVLQGQPARPGQSRPPYPPRDGQAPRGNQQSRPGGQAGRPGGSRPGGPFIPQPQTTDKPATPSTKIVKKDQKYTDERYRDQDRRFSSEGEQQQSGRRGRGTDRSKRAPQGRRTAEQLRSNTQIPTQVELAGSITVKGLADLLKTDGQTIIRKLMQFGILASINQEIDLETATIIITDLGSSVIAPKEAFNPESIVAEEEDAEETLITRPPVVTVMGHVDHGKTSLLDAIRSTNVVAGEAGGITQHIGAYTVDLDGRWITFLDTPGHAAFTAMRARGAKVTDIAILVVAADDGVMPQTVEAINHAKAANVPIVVAINKIDKPGANPERVKQELTEHNLIAEEWGGDTIMVPVSAVRGDGIADLLESVLLVADVADLRANPNRRAVGTVIEAKLDRGRGPVATILVHKGTLNIGDILVVGSTFGRIRAMIDDKGRRVRSVGPSQPVEVVGLAEVPEASDSCNAVEDERAARILAETRAMNKRQEEQSRSGRVSLEDLFSRMQSGEIKDLNLILKGDVHGSVEAIRLSLERLTTKEVRVVIVHTGVGAITESDIMLAAASGAIIIGFNVRPDANAQRIAEQQKVDIRTYRVIYEILDDVQAAMKGLLSPVIKESIIAHVEVREIFRISKVGSIAGCYVLDGRITRAATVRVVRDGKVIHEGKIASLRRIKDDVREVASGYECGILLERFNDIKEGDRFEAFVMEEIKRTEL
ncbi:MAG: translation initiation factor IF-2 [Symbiobacteriaceae bacterium]|nr:translation initiation factor IF-2 [Symbiobacteriaceae bacterium]